MVSKLNSFCHLILNTQIIEILFQVAAFYIPWSWFLPIFHSNLTSRQHTVPDWDKNLFSCFSSSPRADNWSGLRLISLFMIAPPPPVLPDTVVSIHLSQFNILLTVWSGLVGFFCGNSSRSMLLLLSYWNWCFTVKNHMDLMMVLVSIIV